MAASKKKSPEIDEDAFRSMVAQQGKGGDTLSSAAPPTAFVRASTSEPAPIALPDSDEVRHDDSHETLPLKDARRKRSVKPDFDEILFGNANPNKSSPKTVYISEQTHRDLTVIVSKLTHSRVNISTYVENIIRHHFAMYRDEINERGRNSNDDILR